MRLRHLILAALLMPAPVLAHADEFDGKKELTNDDKATIQADEDEKHKAIDEKYKDDNSDEARAAKMREYDEADRAVLDKHGVDQKDFARQDSESTPEDREQIESSKKAIEAKREKEREEAAKPKQQQQLPQVIKGFDDNHPLDVVGGDQGKPAEKQQLDANGNPIPTVEKLNPADDPNAATDGSGNPDAPPPGKDLSNTPIQRHKGGGGHHRRQRSRDE